MGNQSIIIDAQYQPHEVIKQNPEQPCPEEILESLGLLDVQYLGFDGKLHQGQIVIALHVMAEVEAFFHQALELKFPIEKVVPAAASPYEWNDMKLMADNATSGFNYRPIAGTKKLSNHARGLAFDVNTRVNPCIRIQKGRKGTQPPGAVWNKQAAGALYADHPLVRLMEGFGWEWGGHWTLKHDKIVDYQHLQKPKLS